MFPRYRAFITPRRLTDEERERIGTDRTHVLIFDPHLRIELPSEGRNVWVTSATDRRFWDVREANGECSVSLPHDNAAKSVAVEEDDD